MTTPDLSRRKLLGLAAAGAGALALGACGDTTSTASSSTTAKASAQKDFGGLEITTAIYAKNHASSPLYWQQFAPPGLKVKPVVFTSAGDISKALAAGNLDFGLMGYFNTLVEATTTGMASRIICMCSRQGIGLIARQDRGITTVADLKGKKVALAPPGVQTLVLTAVLDKVGLKLGTDVQTVPLGFAEHYGALERGDVDAYLGTEPAPTKSVLSGVGIRLPGVYDTPGGDINTAMWAAPKNLGNPDLLTAVAKMQRDAAELLTPNGVNSDTEWRKLIVDQFGESEELYKALLENVGAVWKFDDKRKSQFQGAADLMLAQGFVKTEPNIDELLLLDYQPKS